MFFSGNSGSTPSHGNYSIKKLVGSCGVFENGMEISLNVFTAKFPELQRPFQKFPKTSRNLEGTIVEARVVPGV